jgi:hypothetical protein
MSQLRRLVVHLGLDHVACHFPGTVTITMAQLPDPQEQESRCLIRAHGSLSAIAFRVTSAVKMLASPPAFWLPAWLVVARGVRTFGWPTVYCSEFVTIRLL